MITVVKRNGAQVPFDRNKIITAISKAFIEVDGKIYEMDTINDIARDIENDFKNRDAISIEEIQDKVEEYLMRSERLDVAKAYIKYRYKRQVARSASDTFMKAIGEKINGLNIENQNANVDEHSFGGRKGEADSILMKKYALDYIVSNMSRRNHENNRIYIHDLSDYAIGSHNCYLRNTNFVTSDGIKSFADYHDGANVKILTKEGKWRDATIHYYGRQPMYEITLARCGITKTLVATRNHRWLLANGTFTDNLQVDDMLYPLPLMEEEDISTKREAEMFALGFILGDGYDRKNEYLEVKFCTAEKEQYLNLFEQAGYRITINNGYKTARKKTPYLKQEFLTNKMWRILSFRDKQCLFKGLLAAYGSKTTNTKYLWTSDKRMCELIEDISVLSGYHIFKKKIDVSDTNYKKERVLYQYVFTTRYSSNRTWKVVSIQKGEHRDKDYEAWCLEEPVTHTFTLEGGIITGNCLSIPFDHLLADGFNTRQTDIRPANSINTAFQLLAVIFQLQSLQQFG